MRRVRLARGLACAGAPLLLLAPLSPAACSPSSGGGPPASEGGPATTRDAALSDVTLASEGGISPGELDASAEASAGDGGSFDSGDAAPDGSLWTGDCGLGPQGEPLDLQCTGLYSDWASKTIARGVEAYTPGYQLWSDGAQKSRWVALPAGQIDTSSMDEWTFPVGTRFWKEFRVLFGDASVPARIETRLLWKRNASTWLRTTYRWSADGESDATELTGGELDANGLGYEIPDQGACSTCHQGRLDGVLGFEAVALSAPGAAGLTMQQLVDGGLVTDPPAAAIQVPGDAIESTALGWLHMNCGTSCHNDVNGEASGTGFFLRLDVATLSSVMTTEAYTTGWNQPTQGFMIPDASISYELRACSLATSAAYVRANTRTSPDGGDPGVQMPPIDSHAVDMTGVAELAAWIDEGCDGG